jgi:uncharacterized protein with beta-barrel porin domain
MAKIIRMRMLAMRCWKVLHNTTTMKVKGSIDRLRLGLGLRAEGQEIVNEGGEIKMNGNHQSLVRSQKTTVAPTITPARSQRVLVMAEMRRVMV